MADMIKRITYEQLSLTAGDLVRCTSAVPGSKGKRYKFLGAVYDPADDANPLYLDLVDIRTGHSRSIRPQFVVKEVASSKAAQARKTRSDAKKASK